MTVEALAWTALAIGVAIGAGVVLLLIGLCAAVLNRRLRAPFGR